MTETRAPLELAGGFAPATYDQWRQLVEKALKGADFDKRLVARTADGLRIKPLYTRADALAEAESAVPGAAPFTRGTAAAADGLGWQIPQRVIEPDPAAANARDPGGAGRRRHRRRPADRRARTDRRQDRERRRHGGRAHRRASRLCARALAGGIEGLERSAPLSRRARERSRPSPAPRISHLNVDPIGTLARFGMAWAPLEAALADTVKLASEARASGVRLTTVLVDATVPARGRRQRGAGACLSRRRARRLPARLRGGRRQARRRAAPTSPSRFPSTPICSSPPPSCARPARSLRASPRPRAPRPQAMHITAVTSARMMAKRDPWTNMLRTTAACAGAAFGGADAVTVLPYTWALGAPDRFARRIARNTQLVLQEESALGRVVDPVGGSWYVEQLTAELAAKAWALFQDIESKGGIVSALTSGALQDDIARVAEARAKAVASGRQELTGVSVFPLLGEDGVKVAPNPAPAPLTGKRQVRPLAPHRLAERVRGLARCRRRLPRQDRRAPARLPRQPRRDRRAQQALDLGVELPGGRRHRGPHQRRLRGRRAAAEAFKASGAKIACLCSSDAIYANEAEAAAKALKAAGATRVLMAGDRARRRPRSGRPASTASYLPARTRSPCSATCTRPWASELERPLAPCAIAQFALAQGSPHTSKERCLACPSCAFSRASLLSSPSSRWWPTPRPRSTAPRPSR